MWKILFKKSVNLVTYQTPCSVVTCFWFPEERTTCVKLMTTYQPGPVGQLESCVEKENQNDLNYDFSWSLNCPCNLAQTSRTDIKSHLGVRPSRFFAAHIKVRCSLLYPIISTSIFVSKCEFRSQFCDKSEYSTMGQIFVPNCSHLCLVLKDFY